jgi:MoaA/NifB/PqqE/SkfB family radical SAM enzyme
MNTIENIYKELGDNICLYPFFGAFYQTNNVVSKTEGSMPNSVRPCSIVMYDDRHKWDIVDASVYNGRNTPAWKQMRQNFIDNKFHEIHDCRTCSSNEQAGATSPRQQNNKFLTQFLQTDIVSEVKRIMNNDNTVEDILTLDYYPSNYCNFSCIMCAGGASSQRQTFEVKVLRKNEHTVLNAADPDFFAALEKVQVINFSGGETALQKQVHDIMEYLIEKDLAKNILITLLSNASSSANDLDEKFCKFKQVIYNISIDGINDVIEYQRRGAKWSKVEANALELMDHRYISTVINYVLTGVNVLSIMDFVNWAYDAKFGPHNPEDVQGSFINVSPVFRVDHLGVAVLPDQLRELALNRLKQGRKRFESSTEIFDIYYTQLVDQFIGVIETTTHNPAYLPEFIKHIQLEDSVSKTKLIEVVPEWAPYFQS